MTNVLVRNGSEQIHLTPAPDGGTQVMIVTWRGLAMRFLVVEDIETCKIEALTRGFVMTADR